MKKYILFLANINIYPPSFSENWTIHTLLFSWTDEIGLSKVIFFELLSSKLEVKKWIPSLATINIFWLNNVNIFGYCKPSISS